MDGTLYNNAFHEVSEKTFVALNALQKKGNRVCLATSRCLSELKNLPKCMREFQFDYQIVDGGSLILDANDDIVFEQGMKLDDMHKIVQFCTEYQVQFRYSTKSGNYFHFKPGLYEHQIFFELYLNVPEYKPYNDEDVLNVLIFCSGNLKERAKECLSSCSIVEYPDCLEIRADHVDKASAIQRLISHDETIYCFGDGENDMDMLKLADVGVCMGNGYDALKAVADIVIGRCDEDGIYTYLKGKVEL